MNKEISPISKEIVIVGGGTAGWMAAAALSKTLPKEVFNIQLVESPDIATVGVGEASIPAIETFHRLIGLNSKEFIKQTDATFKLGIRFTNWYLNGTEYIHPFGSYGPDLYNLPFSQVWNSAKIRIPDLNLANFSINSKLIENGAFLPAQNIPNSPLSSIQHAYHFDSKLYAKLLQKIAIEQGAQSKVANVINANLDSNTGFIQSLNLDNGELLKGDFFIDCSGFSGLLIDKTLNTKYESWNDFLICDSAHTIHSEKIDPLPNYTQSTALPHGWQWKIPLSNRTGNGYVYSSSFTSDLSAQRTLEMNLTTAPIGPIRTIRFTPGKRKKIWNKNCLSLGLSSGFIEPLESTSIHLIQSALSKFLGIFPNFKNFSAEQNVFNSQIDKQLYSIRDFIILHYKATERDDSEFWQYCKNMKIPDSLGEKIELYLSCGHVKKDEYDLFSENSWLSVFNGQNVLPRCDNQLLSHIADDELTNRLKEISEITRKCSTSAPKHEDFLKKIISQSA